MGGHAFQKPPAGLIVPKADEVLSTRRSTPDARLASNSRSSYVTVLWCQRCLHSIVHLLLCPSVCCDELNRVPTCMLCLHLHLHPLIVPNTPITSLLCGGGGRSSLASQATFPMPQRHDPSSPIPRLASRSSPLRVADQHSCGCPQQLTPQRAVLFHGNAEVFNTPVFIPAMTWEYMP